MLQKQKVVITGLGLELPEKFKGGGIFDSVVDWEGISSFSLEKRIGKKGLRYKDQATKMAIYAAGEALKSAGFPTEHSKMKEGRSFGVIASSNLGNIPTVLKVLEEIRAQNVDGTSPMDLPNASSNIIASTLAIWYGLSALNLMICNGGTSGADALHIASNAIKVQRVKRMLVAGVEISHPSVEKIVYGKNATGEKVVTNRLCNVAACVVMESLESALERGAKPLAEYVDYQTLPNGVFAKKHFPIAVGSKGEKLFWLVGKSSKSIVEKITGNGKGVAGKLGEVGIVHVAPSEVETYGALGLLQAAMATILLDRKKADKVLATCGGNFGESTATVVFKSHFVNTPRKITSTAGSFVEKNSAREE